LTDTPPAGSPAAPPKTDATPDNPSEKDVAVAFVDAWTACSDLPNASLADIEQQLRVLSSVGRIGIDLWQRYYTSERDREVSPAVWAKTRAAFFSGTLATRAAGRGAKVFEAYKAAVISADGPTKLIVERTSDLERKVEALAERAIAEASGIRELISDQRVALESALPDGEATALNTKLAALTHTVEAIRTKVAPHKPESKHPNRDLVLEALRNWGKESMIALAGLVGAFLIISALGMAGGWIGELFGSVYRGLQEHAHLPGELMRPPPGATQPPRCSAGYLFDKTQGVCVAPKSGG
jgi:hypothetical protein